MGLQVARSVIELELQALATGLAAKAVLGDHRNVEALERRLQTGVRPVAVRHTSNAPAAGRGDSPGRSGRGAGGAGVPRPSEEEIEEADEQQDHQRHQPGSRALRQIRGVHALSRLLIGAAVGANRRLGIDGVVAEDAALDPIPYEARRLDRHRREV
jgi:hypothetical protein